MKFFKPKEPRKTILFVCVENGARSQMAEGYFRKYAPDGFLAISAGTKPVAELNPLAVEAMRDADIDISHVTLQVPLLHIKWSTRKSKRSLEQQQK